MLDKPISVFIDSNIFMSWNYSIHKEGYLNILKTSVKKNEIKLYTSDIVIREVEKHIRKDALGSIKILLDAKKAVQKNISPSLLKETSLFNIFEIEKGYMEKEVEGILEKYRKKLKETNITILNNEGVDIESVMEDYFQVRLPFKNKESKKHEFPDAFMVSKLKKEFNKENPISIISNDDGFRKTLENNEGFTCFDSINKFLNKLNQENKNYDEIVAKINDKKFRKQILEKITREINLSQIEVDGLDSDRKGYDYEDVYIETKSIDDYEFISINEMRENFVDLTVLCKGEVSIIGSYYDYDNSIWDYEGKRYIYLDIRENYEKHEPKFKCRLLFKFNKNYELSFENIEYTLVLDENSRKFREPSEYERYKSYDRMRIDAIGDMMDTLEDYHNH